MTLPTILIIIVTGVFLFWERILPGRSLPISKGWYLRSIAINMTQLVITLVAGKLWISVFSGGSIVDLENIGSPVLQGFVGWFVGTFVFYWWHRLRHVKGFWVVFHQIHHSASRIEMLTSFYKHPLEIFINSFITAIILFPILGCSLLGSIWYNLFAAIGEYFYHANVKTPKWLRYFVQTPELHSIHHALGVHKYNFSDIPIWDRIFGTYKDTTKFSKKCGFPNDNEQKIWKMLIFKDVYDD
ncbi:sterol desaturase family protein [Gilvimarinus polysaccharolyticus]|uniref:sterol desaturase family protein n=1 Tax=Gilvimarinus polysaccharolyticus TaxID=863921 RepID=UPI0006737609|nr:sterol desaturase family protein [Gilvimarinus polysaccharolyticus]